MPLRPAATAYLALQGVLILAWWGGLWRSPALRALFLAPAARDTELLAFWLPDLLLAAGGSLLGAWLLHRGSPRAAPLLWGLTGAMGYAMLYCLALSLATGAAWAGTAAMLPAAALTLTTTLLLAPVHAQGRRSP